MNVSKHEGIEESTINKRISVFIRTGPLKLTTVFNPKFRIVLLKMTTLFYPKFRTVPVK